MRGSDLRGRAYEALLARISGRYPKYEEIRGKANSIKAGAAGEDRLLGHLKKLGLAYPVLHDISLRIAPGHFAQFDVLVLTPSHAIIYEAKNMAAAFASKPLRRVWIKSMKRAKLLIATIARFFSLRMKSQISGPGSIIMIFHMP